MGWFRRWFVGWFGFGFAWFSCGWFANLVGWFAVACLDWFRWFGGRGFAGWFGFVCWRRFARKRNRNYICRFGSAAGS